MANSVKELLGLEIGDYSKAAVDLLKEWNKGSKHLREEIKAAQPSLKYFSEVELSRYWMRIPELKRQIDSIEAREMTPTSMLKFILNRESE